MYVSKLYTPVWYIYIMVVGGRGVVAFSFVHCFSEHLAGHLGDEVHGHHGEDETGGQEQHYERVHTQSVGLVGENLQDAAAGAPNPAARAEVGVCVCCFSFTACACLLLCNVR